MMGRRRREKEILEMYIVIVPTCIKERVTHLPFSPLFLFPLGTKHPLLHMHIYTRGVDCCAIHPELVPEKPLHTTKV
jgi:hypothetical protein